MRAFQSWVAAGRPAQNQFIQNYHDPVLNKPVPSKTLQKWVLADDWTGQAEALEVKARKKTENELVRQRVSMLKRQRKIGIRLQKKGYDFLENNGLQNEFAAIRALEVGTSLERASIGTPEMFEDIGGMSDEEVMQALQLLAEADEADTDTQGFSEGAQLIDVTPK